MNAATATSNDLVRDVVRRAGEAFASTLHVDTVWRAEFLAIGELSMAERLGRISADEMKSGVQSIGNASADRTRTLRALERQAARDAAA